MASLSATTPAAGYIIANQATAGLLDVTFTGSGVVNSVTLKRSGISSQDTLSNVYLYDGVTRLTDGYSFNSQGTITINNLNLMVNGSKTVSVKADASSTAGNDSTIAVSLTGFTSGASVNTVNIMGNLMNLAAGTSMASVTLSGSNTVAAATNVNAGTTSYAVWRQAFQVNTRTVSLKAANFRVTGSAPADALANVGLYVDGVKVGGNAVMQTINGSNYATFDLTNASVSLTTGSHTLEVRGDIVKGSSYNFTVSLQQASDLMIMDPQVGVNIAVTSFSASTAGQIGIGTGSVTVVVDPTFSTMSNVTGGSSNAVIGKFKLHTYGEDVKITSLPVSVSLSSAATPAGIQNVTLYYNGSQVGSQVSLSSGTGSLAPSCVAVGTGTCYSTTFSLGSQMILPAGADSYIEVRADLRNTAGANYTAGSVSANLGAASGEGWNSKATVTTTAKAGTSLTVQTGLLAVSKNTGYANQTQNPNTVGVKIASFVLQNQSSSESVRVTSLTVAPVGTGSAALTDISGLRTSEVSGSGNVPQQPATTNTFTVDFTLAPGATKTIDILADTGSTTSVTTIANLTVNALGSSSNTSICVDADSNCTNGGTGVVGQTITLSAGTVATPTLLTASATSAQYIAAGDPMATGTGASDATKASYSFVSTGGAATISELKFTITGSATDPVMSVKVGGVSAPVVGGIAWLQGLNIVVPNGGSGALQS
jgi:hypothetical protein